MTMETKDRKEAFGFIDIYQRTEKIRKSGLTMVLDRSGAEPLVKEN